MASIFILLVILIINITLWILLFTRLRREFSPDAVLYSIRDEVDKLIIEINRVADRDITLIEARRNGLMQLLEDIDKKISLQSSLNTANAVERKVLKKLARIEETPAADKNEPSLFSDQVTDSLFGEPIAAGEKPVLPVHPVSRAASVYKRNDIPELNTEPIVKEEKEEEPIHITFSSDPISPKKDKRRSVLSMAHEGFSAEIIAEKLKIPVREVSLIMDLYN